ncbi:hypothetical protein PFNF135_05223 [Plasmodium falciparum NF135/5.C10]|uniref:Uncharacterized protein n=1 Tax=Plasmodium falciparum NF135/5.C10 TaxID=1036726 RepID=W4I9N1_PLAFA|nr:hypothetical protein PFNF135_05223 [Plasmodium falciparum NF135/5.C10]
MIYIEKLISANKIIHEQIFLKDFQETNYKYLIQENIHLNSNTFVEDLESEKILNEKIKKEYETKHLDLKLKNELLENNLLAIFFKTLLGQSNTSQSSNGKNNDDDDGFFKKKRTGGLPKSRIMELKNLGTCLGST